VTNAAFLLVGPLLLGDPLPREMYDGVETFERGGVDATGLGFPADGVARGDAAAAEREHPVPVGAQRARQRATDQAACTCDRDVHRRLLGTAHRRTPRLR